MKSKIRQIWSKAEVEEGTHLIPSASTDAVYALEPTWDIDPEQLPEDRVRTNLDATPIRIGQRRVTTGFGIDFKGGGASAGAPLLPPWDLEFRAAGMQVEGLAKVVPAGGGGALSGPINHGATFEQIQVVGPPVVKATGIIIGDYTDTPAPTRIIYRGLLGTLDATNVVTVTNPGGTPGPATFTPTATPVSHGFLYRFVNDVWSGGNRGAWTGTPQAGEIVKGETSGAVGKLLETTLPVGSVGQLWIETLFGTFVNGETITGQTSTATCSLTSTPPLSLAHNISLSRAFLLDGKIMTASGMRNNVTLPLRTGFPMRANVESRGFFVTEATYPIPSATYSAAAIAQAPRFAGGEFLIGEPTGAFAGLPMGYLDQFELNFGNELGIRPDVSNAEGGNSYRISNRTAQLNFNPEMVPPAAYDFIGKWTAGTLFGVRVRTGCAQASIGTVGANIGAILWIDIPQMQYERITTGDREGTATAQAQGRLTGTGTGDPLGAGRSDSFYIYVL